MPVTVSPTGNRRRPGKIIPLLAVTIPMIFGMTGLVVDIGLMSVDNQKLKHASDAAAAAGMLSIQRGGSITDATSVATSCIQNWNGLSTASITVNMPPVHGQCAGLPHCLEVVASLNRETSFSRLVGVGKQASVSVWSVASSEPSTAGAGVVVLDPSPPTLNIIGLPVGIAALPSLTGGMEVIGLGKLEVDGAIHVNNTWGASDENGEDAGILNGLLHGMTCTPVLPLTHVSARDIRVVGGVDNPVNYGALGSGQPSPLRCNRMPVPDPHRLLPVPTVATDPINVKSALKGGVTVISLPLLGTTTLQPGVYDWIEIVSGNVKFQPGVYIIRSKNPLTGISLNVLTGNITADGVMFYITNTSNYDGVNGGPDSGDGEVAPGRGATLNLIPSVVINGAVTLGSRFSGLNSPGSPFNGMFLYQRRQDVRPIVITHQALLGAAHLQGRMYAKWGHISFVGDSTYDISLVAGTIRFVTVLGMTIEPSNLLDPAYDVYLMP
ncbi:MAG: hypothetical protein JSS49_18925 [Planctomycetes bacterium]|nr:hypothetical protein [Planctomycetota bacterium]